MLVCPVYLVRYVAPGAVDGVASATPLHHMVMPALPEESIAQMFMGNIGGTIGEVCTAALLIGGIYLIWRGVISVRIPAAYLGTVAVLTLVFSKGDNAFAWMLYSLLGGGVVLGALFMATDYVTSPMSNVGGIIFGVGIGIITMLIRYFGAYPEGMSFAILIMNSVVPLINKWCHTKKYGR